jgi:TPR repeat protein
MRSYVRPLIVTFSSFMLASLFSYAAIALTEPTKPREESSPRPSPSASTAIKKSPEMEAVESYTKAKMEAAGGDPKKLMALANFYLLGFGTEKNENEAARLHKIGAEKGDAFCQSCYGRDLLLGIGVKKDVDAALIWLRKSAAQKQPEAEYVLHQLYAEGTEVKADPDEARQWLLRAAEHGQHDARANLAEEILQAKDQKRAKSVLSWVRPGAMAGHARSCYIMGFIYSVGIGVKTDDVEAMAWRMVLLNIEDEDNSRSWKIDYKGLGEADQAKAEKRAKELSGEREYLSPFARDPVELAAEKKDYEETKQKAEKGDVDAQYHLAMLYDFGRGTEKNDTEAARWCRKAAEKGHAEAQFSLAQTLRRGEAVAPDMKEAFAWFMKSALQGYPEAEHALSVCYQNGDGVKENEVEARKWRQKAAEKGNPRSQCNLGNEYYGAGPDLANDAIAARWYRKAAVQLHPKGGFSLGLCYLTGRGVPQNKIEGLAWMLTSAENLAPEFKDGLVNIMNDFTEDEIKKAKSRSDELFKECIAKLEAAQDKAPSTVSK